MLNTKEKKSKNRLGLRSKIILVSIIPSLLIVGIITYLSILRQKEIITQGHLKYSEILLEIFTTHFHTKSDFEDSLLVEYQIDKIMELYPDIEKLSLYVLKKNRYIRISSSDPDAIDKPALSEDIDTLLNNKIIVKQKRDKDTLEIIAPLKIEGMPVFAVLEIDIDIDMDNKLIVDQSIRFFLIGIGGFLFLTAVLYLSLKRFILSPINYIKSVSNQIAKGNPNAEIIVDWKDEMGELAESINIMSTALKVRASLLTKEIETISVMSAIDKAIISNMDMDDIMDIVKENVKRLVPSKCISITILNQKFNTFSITLHEGCNAEKNIVIRIDENIFLNETIRTKRPVMVPDLYSEKNLPSMERMLIKEYGINSLLAVPLMARGKTIGTLNFGSEITGFFTEEHISTASHIATQVAIAIENARMYKQQKREAAISSALLKTSELLNSTIYPDEVLNKILDSVESLVNADTCSIMLLNDKNILTIKAYRGIDPRYAQEAHIKVGEGIVGWSVLHGKPLLIQDTVADGNFINYTRHEKDIVSSISLPLKTKDKVIGAMCINSDDSSNRFTEDDLKLMTLFSSQASVAIENARLFEEVVKKTNDLREANFDTVKALAEALETKDAYTRGHSDRILKYSMEIAERLGLSEKEKEDIQYAAVLHDIGKIGISDTIINKPGRLTKDEFNIMKEHPEKGADIIRQIKHLEKVVPLVYHHQERWDGKGYPDGISGKDIPIGARIVAVIDAFDAMTSNRIYRFAPGKKKAIEELKKYAGTQFDPEVVGVFLDILDKEKNGE
ncbi:MAG: HD domain-containing phosphohydrolase [Nitrospirota bacterium]